MTDRYAQVNGDASGCIDLSDRGFNYGHGVFETMRLVGGIVPLWKYHRQRLLSGAERLRIPLTVLWLDEALDRFRAACPGDGVIKLVVTAGSGQRGYRLGDAVKPGLAVQWFPSPVVLGKADQRIVRLQVSRYRLPRNPVLAGIKHLNRLDQVIASFGLPDNVEALLLSDEDLVVEALNSNLFCLSKGRWSTPDLGLNGVEGVMRRCLIEEVLPTVETVSSEVDIQSVDLPSLSRADEVFVCNAVRGVVPVQSLLDEEGSMIMQWQAFPATEAVRRQLARHIPCFGA